MKASTFFKTNSQKVISQNIKGEVILINLEKGNYYSIRGGGTDIWCALERGTTLERILVELGKQCHDPITQKDIQTTVMEFWDRLIAENLIVPHLDENMVAFYPQQDPAQSIQDPVLEIYDDLKEMIMLDSIHSISENLD